MGDELNSKIGAKEIRDPELPPEYAGGSGSKVVTIFLSLLVLLGFAGAGAFGYLWSESEKQVVAREQEARGMVSTISTLENLRDDLQGQLVDSQAELQREQAEREKEREQLKADSREKLQRAYAQFNEIVYDSRKTLEYIGSVEEKLKTGQKLDEQEADKLSSVVNGLTLLHDQYRKPIQEFRELERFLSDQLAVPAMVPPKERYGLFKRMFGQEFKQEREAYYKDQGQREAFDRAKTKVTEAYARAQAQMKELSMDSGDYLDELQKIVQSNEADAANVDEFFAKSKEILKIHDKIMNIEPEEGLQGVRP